MLQVSLRHGTTHRAFEASRVGSRTCEDLEHNQPTKFILSSTKDDVKHFQPYSDRTKPILNHIKPSSFIHFGAWSFRHIMTHGDLQKAAGEFLVRHTGGMDHPLMLLRRSLGWGHQQPLHPSVHPSILPTYLHTIYLKILKVPPQKRTEHEYNLSLFLGPKAEVSSPAPRRWRRRKRWCWLLRCRQNVGKSMEKLGTSSGLWHFSRILIGYEWELRGF